VFIRRPGVVLAVSGLLGGAASSIRAKVEGSACPKLPASAAHWLVQHELDRPACWVLIFIVVLLPVVLAFLLVSVINTILIFGTGRQELSERTRGRWRQALTARMDGREPHFRYEDTLDRAAQLKMAMQRLAYRLRRNA
jgi:hypothetical protein